MPRACRPPRSATRRAQGRPARDRHRQPARDVLELGHQRDRVRQGPLDHDRRQPEPHQPHPDRRGDQPGQLGRSAARRRGQRHRHQHGHRPRQQRHRLRHPDRHRPPDHGAGGRRRGPLRRPYIGIRYRPITRQFADGREPAGQVEGARGIQRQRQHGPAVSRPGRRPTRPASRTATSSSHQRQGRSTRNIRSMRRSPSSHRATRRRHDPARRPT